MGGSRPLEPRSYEPILVEEPPGGCKLKFLCESDETFPVVIRLADTGGRFPRVLSNKTEEDLLIQSGKLSPDQIKEETAYFRYWSYGDELALREAATVVDELRQTRYINSTVYERERIRRFLREWTLAEYDPDLKLEVDSHTKMLTDKSLKVALSVCPQVISAFINEATKIVEMGVGESKN